jgi:hypothetical protein
MTGTSTPTAVLQVQPPQPSQQPQQQPPRSAKKMRLTKSHDETTVQALFAQVVPPLPAPDQEQMTD